MPARRDPIRQLLAPHRLGVGEARCAQDGDKNLYRYDLTGEAIDDLADAASKVDKQLLAGDMGLAHRRLQPTSDTLSAGISFPCCLAKKRTYARLRTVDDAGRYTLT